ncbi:MAG: CRISPR-associated helicase Cas3' [Polyangia bacterium]
MDFGELFEKATGFSPYPYQCKLAEASCPPSRLSVPTGLGKTAAAVVGWLWRRRYAPQATRSSTPRRLVYCLPMRVLVEQTRDKAASWVEKLGLSEEVCVHTLMGGDIDADWDINPERDAILVGTQDMLLSRALNRGYSMSRFRWPLQFGLLNNDCLWVMDEVQLMGSGLATTAQLQAFRRVLGHSAPSISLWMSATMRPEWLDTVDFVLDEDSPRDIGLETYDYEKQSVRERFHAKKPVEKVDLADGKSGEAEAARILEAHAEAGGRTLVVVNTVKRAKAIHKAVVKEKPAAELLLVHSQFRPGDREQVIDRLLETPGEHGTIAISTQVVEAGVDVSAKTLFTDLAPWASLVQRFGRCNRKGDMENASVFWFDVDTKKKGAALPYEAEELNDARELLEALRDARPSDLPEVSPDFSARHVIRRRDIIELFDTTPDLAGADIDVSRFIREADDHGVQLFWRALEGRKPEAEEPGPRREELCSVPISEAREFAKKNALWRWDHLERGWIRPDAIYPGLVLMADCKSGGYSPEKGWDLKAKRAVEQFESDAARAEANDDDRYVESDWETLAEHTDEVLAELDRIIEACEFEDDESMESLRLAARWHDAGKAHSQFQQALVEADPSKLWAKAPEIRRYERPGFRHELASALAMLEQGHPDLAAYLAAAHHGKVRLSIRSLPHEQHPDDHSARFARGVWDGDELPEADLGGGVKLDATTIDLSYMELGEGEKGPSWLARMLTLRDEFGPFRLAYLEALLRAADRRASAGKGGAR